MFRHYFATALRNYARNPLSTGIKLAALSLGLLCFLTAHVVGDYLRQSDRHWANADRIRVIAQHQTPPGSSEEIRGIAAAAAAPAAKYLRLDFPELEAVARQIMNTVAVRAGETQITLNAAGVDPDFVRIFELTPVSGDVGSLDAPRTALIEESAARQLFGDGDPVGRTLTLGAGVDVTVAGVFAAIPTPTAMDLFKVIVSMATADDIVQAQFSQIQGMSNMIRMSEAENWAFPNFMTFVLLPEDGSLTPSELQRRLPDFAQRRVPPETGEARFEALPLAGLSAARVDQQLFGGAQGLSLVTVLYLLGALILAVGCLDFSNIATAQAEARAKEFGLRRTLGASQGQIAAQALFETGFLAAAALALVLPLTLLAIAPLQAVINMDVSLPGPARADFWLSVLSLLAGATLLAGAYPALVLARIRPILALRAARRASSGVRTALIVAQFAVAAFLANTVMVMLAQKAELRVSMGVDEPVVMLSYSSAQPVNMETLRTELLRDPSIVSVTYGMTPFVRISGALNRFAASSDPGAPYVAAQNRGISTDYFRTAGIRLLAGREFSTERDTPYSLPLPAVIDEATAALLGFTPEQAVGQTIYQIAEASSPVPQPPRATLIVGVVENRPLEYMTSGATNYVYTYQPNFALQPTPLIRISSRDAPAALEHIDATWKRLNPDAPAMRMFLDELFEGGFRMFNMLNSVVIALSGIAIAIAAMGLFGMASFVVQRRVREIGVRKTLGASSARVLGLMLWDFSRPVIVANVIAWPFAWIAARAYLDLFVTRIDLTPWPFLLALAVSLLVAWIAVGVHAFGAARVKPALVLRAE